MLFWGFCYTWSYDVAKFMNAASLACRIDTIIFFTTKRIVAFTSFYCNMISIGTIAPHVLSQLSISYHVGLILIYPVTWIILNHCCWWNIVPNWCHANTNISFILISSQTKCTTIMAGRSNLYTNLMLFGRQTLYY